MKWIIGLGLVVVGPVHLLHALMTERFGVGFAAIVAIALGCVLLEETRGQHHDCCRHRDPDRGSTP